MRIVLCKNLARLGVLRGGQLVGELHRHLRGDDLGRVDGAGDDDDRLAFAHQTVALGLVPDEPRVGEAALDFAILVEFAYILWRADESREERAAERRRADGLDADAPARARRGASEVVGDLLPVGDLAVVAGREAEHVARRGHAARGRCRWRCDAARRGGLRAAARAACAAMRGSDGQAAETSAAAKKERRAAKERLMHPESLPKEIEGRERSGGLTKAESSTAPRRTLAGRLWYWWSLFVAAMLLLVIGPPAIIASRVAGRRQWLYPFALFGARNWLRLSGVRVRVRGLGAISTRGGLTSSSPTTAPSSTRRCSSATCGGASASSPRRSC